MRGGFRAWVTLESGVEGTRREKLEIGVEIEGVVKKDQATRILSPFPVNVYFYYPTIGQSLYCPSA